MENDPRFEEKLKQPKFRRIPNHERKVKIDKRFKSMFKDDKFQVKYTVDKRGRPVNKTAKEDLRRYYDLGSDESSDEEEEDGTAAATIDDDNFAKQDGKISEKVKRKLKNLKVDYARGEGVLLSDSSSDDEESEEEEEEGEDGSIDHAWGELDQDAEHTTEITCRLAACNMNWDRIRAVDLMVLLSCFVPGSGVIQSVTIYPSEFGIERMREEELKGPMELVESEAKNDGDDHDGSKYHMEKLRQYELNRLKYYYAVIVFDSCGSANKVYEECDGVEYEATSTKFDLRFIPDDVTFDQEPKDVCTKLPDPSEYKPKYFTTCALQQTKVNLTWDETDPYRTEITKRLNSKQDVDYNDVQAYLASTSEEEESEEEVSDDDEEEENLKGLSSINRYKSLLLGLEDGESSTKNDGGLEISWGVDQKEKAEQMVKQKLSEKEKKTPFQMYLEKRKEKKRLKREAAKRKTEDEKDDDSDDIPSDVDLDDPFFAEELKSKKKNNKKKSRKNRKEESEEDEQQKAELALLLANNDDDGRKHFSLKEIQKRESEEDPKKNRKKKKVAEEKETVEDDFKINVDDERFSALYNNHLFSIDPNDPNYKKTKGTAAIESEKVRRREKVVCVQEEETKLKKPAAIRPETQILIKRMKRKAEAFDSKNKRKKMKQS